MWDWRNLGAAAARKAKAAGRKEEGWAMQEEEVVAAVAYQEARLTVHNQTYRHRISVRFYHVCRG
jgi:hypothetical protein